MILLDDGSPYKEAWDNYTGNYVDLTGLVESTVEEKSAEGLAMLQKRPGYEDATSFELGTVYGSFEEGTAYVAILEPNRIHEAAFVSTQTIGNILKYAMEAINDAVPNPIDYNNQIWVYKDYTGLFGIFAFGAFICALALLLIEEVPAFNGVKRPIPRNIGLRKVGLGISVILAIILGFFTKA